MAASAKSKENLWEVAFSQLPEDQQKALKAGLVLPLRFEDLTTTIEKAREHAASKWKITTRHGEIDVRASFSNIVSWVQRFIQVGDVVVNYDPRHAALPWAAVRLVLQVLVNNTTRAAKFIEGVEQVAFYIYDSTVRENLYLAVEPCEDSNDLKKHILTLYATVLHFLLRARLFFEASSTKRILSGITKSADDVIQLLGPIAQQASQIVTISGRIDAKAQISTTISMLSLSESHAKSMEWLRHQVRTNDTLMSSLITSMASNHHETMSRFDKLEKSYNEHDRLKILSWLSAIPYHQHHKKAHSEVLEGTGSWFLEDSEYIRWRGCDESAMLWIHGIAGSGKSKLVSLAIQTALEGSTELLRPLYFYCSRSAAEPERARAEDIMRSLVKQLSTYGVSYNANTIPDYVVEKYRTVESQDFASGDLSFEESCDFISRFAADHRRLLLIVDGLDECNEDARHMLIQGFNDIIRNSSTAVVRLLISSRDSPYLTTYFEDHQTYEVRVESNRNQQDINMYVEKQLQQLILQKRLRLDEGKQPSAKLRQLIVARLCDEAQGMFRWVSLQIDYICTLQKASDIRKRLGKLPKSLSNSYQELYDRKFEEYEPEERKRLEIALSLLLVSRRPTSARVFSKFVFWDNDEADEDDETDEDEDDEGNREDNGSASSMDKDEETDIGHNSESNVDVEDPGNKTEEEHIQTLDDSDAYEEYERPSPQQYEPITRLCFDLVVFDRAARVFRFAHTSVQDYLINHNSTYQMSCDNHARLAKRCISILLHTIANCRYHFEKFPIDENPIQGWEDKEKLFSDIEDGWKGKMEGNLTKRPVSSLIGLWVPRYTKVHRRRLDPETLDDYMLPWKWDDRDPDFILMMCRVPGFDLEILFEHTRKVRARRRTDLGEAHSEISLVSKQGHADSKTAARATWDKSKLPSLSSGGQALQVHDFWYFDSPPSCEMTLLESFLSFVDQSWAFYTSNSGEVRGTKDFKELENELQHQFTRQFWRTVRPWVFFSACRDGLITHVQTWMRAYPRLARTTQRVPFRTTALMEIIGSDQSHPEIAKILIDNGAETSYLPEDGSENPLCKAAARGEEAITLLLLDKRPDLVSTLGSCMSSPLTQALIFNQPNRLSIVQILLSHGASTNELCDNFHNHRPLHLAARLQDVGVMELLLDNGAFIDAQDAHGLTPLATAILGTAVSAVTIRCCRLLLARGADVHLIDVDGDSLFAAAVIKVGPLPITKLLLEYGADINAKNRMGCSALHLAAIKRRADYVKVLIGWGIDMNATTALGATALHQACQISDAEIAKTLIAAGADVNVSNIVGQNALCVAVYWENLETVKLLIETTTNIDHIDCYGYSALGYAALNGYGAMVDVLLDAGAQVFPQEPGPHCPFLEPEERMPDYFRDPVLAALGSRHFNIAKLIMESAGGREKGSKFAEALHMLDIGDMYGLRRWSANRFRNAPEYRPGIVAKRQDIVARAHELVRENRRRFAAELGIPDADPSDESDSEYDDVF